MISATVLQALRQTQLSASIAHTQARQDAREPSRELSSASRKSRLSANSPADGPDHKTALGEVATKLLVLCVPWPEQWAIHGVWIVSTSADEKRHESSQPQRITGMDHLGDEIISYLPHHLVSDFLSEEGQSLVSDTYHSSST